MWTIITNGVTNLIGVGADVIDAIISADGSWKNLQDLIGIGIAVGLIGWAVRTIKSLAWGF